MQPSERLPQRVAFRTHPAQTAEDKSVEQLWLISNELIEEHRTTAGKRRSDALERVLAYFRRSAVADKYAVLAAKPFAEYRIVALSGRRGVPPRIVDDQVFNAQEEALHGIFLKRVQDLIDS